MQSDFFEADTEGKDTDRTSNSEKRIDLSLQDVSSVELLHRLLFVERPP